MIGVVSSVWALSLLAVVVLWRRRPHSVLDLWLMVVMSVWLFDIALAAVLNAGRFDLGFYAGRIYGLLAASFVLMVLLIENGSLYRRLGDAYLELDRQNRSLEQTVRERTDQLLQSEKVATMGSLLAGVAHELNNPLAVVMGQVMLLQESTAESSYKTRADKIHAAAERCARIVKNFLALARNRPPERGPVAVNGGHPGRRAARVRAADVGRRGRAAALRVGGGLPGRRPSAAPGDRQSPRQRAPGHAPGPGAAPHHARERVRRSGRLRPCHRERYGPRNPTRGAGTDLRGLLHDQAGWRGHGPRTLVVPRNRRGARRDADRRE